MFPLFSFIASVVGICYFVIFYSHLKNVSLISITDHKGSSFFFLSKSFGGGSEIIQINSSSVKYYSQPNGDIQDNAVQGPASETNKTDIDSPYR